MAWQNLNSIGSMQWRCGHCGSFVANNYGFFNKDGKRRIYVCPHCDNPTFYDGTRQMPGVAPGNEVENVPENLDALYREARNCCSVSAYTASVLASRKMLMNIAVQQGADDNLRFIEYVEYLSTNGFIPPNGRGWVDHIRKKGNEATHEIALMGQSDAEELISFAEMLLKFIYEFPSRVPNS